ncbi:MAG: sensor domain-containing diguanylate cyclase [Candidatus Nanopelagicales bacterium]
MRLRKNVLRIPLIYLVLIAVAGVSLTTILVRYDLNEDIAAGDLAATGDAQLLARELSEQFAVFYAPTVAGAGFAGAVVQESQGTGSSQASLLEEGFAAFAQPFLDYLGPALLDFQLSPDGIVTYSARPIDNAAALGHNLFLDDDRRDAVLAAVEARSPIVSGPLDLKQGGKGLIIRQAIFVPDNTPFAQRFTARTGLPALPSELAGVPGDFWGFATTVINVDTFVSALNVAGLPEERFAVQPLNADGTLGPSVLGTFGGSTDDVVTERVTLPDGSQWQVSVAALHGEVWHHWPIIVIGLILTIAAMALAAWAYRVSRRYRLGYSFSDSIADMTGREEVLAATSDFITGLYPRLRGQIDTPPPATVRVPVPSDVDAPDITGTEDVRTWPIQQGGQTHAYVRLQHGAPYAAAEVEEVIGIISRMLGATLGSLEHREELERQSTVDQLTEVFNRRQFQPSYEDLAAAATARGLWLAVGVVDLDDFKGINDSFGHLFGDEMLKELGHALGTAVRGSDTVFRFGGDEFVILALLDSEEQALGLFTRVQASANSALSAMTPDGRPVSISVGYACCPGALIEPMNELLAKADQALYRAKGAGRNRVEDWAFQGSTTGPIAPIG